MRLKPRYAAPDILLRVQNEAQAKNYVVDIVDGTAAILALLAADFMQPYGRPKLRTILPD